MSSTVALLPAETSLIKFPTYDEFRAYVLRQCFSIPLSIVYYMAKNPRSAKVYQKMIRTCKYFFLKNPILVYHCLHYNKNEWKICVNQSCLGPVEDLVYRKVAMDLKKLESKICVTFTLEISSSTSTFASSLIQKLYRGNVKSLVLKEQRILLEELLFLSNKLKHVCLHESYVYYPGGKQLVPFEVIIATLPMVQAFCIEQTNVICDLSKTSTELVKIPHFKNLDVFLCRGFDESFDIEKFFEHLKKNQQTRVYISYTGQLSQEYEEKLDMIIEEILNAELPRSYIPPFIGYDGQLNDQREILYHLCCEYF
uniref:DUF38 domain-containing protein n=1 Tax=Panagrolaimus davidi TaxID=227884 RepID=A0A914PLG4_9BILA